jgi:pyruvate kinase
VAASMHEEFCDIRDQLLALQQHAFDVERIGEDEVALAHPSRRPAARNLIDYLALRQHDITRLQRALQQRGFSSLGVVQGHVMASIDALVGVLDALCGRQRPPLDLSRYPTIENARADLRAHADDTLGPCPADGNVRIMVTMPSAAAWNPAVIDISWRKA